MNKRSHPLCAAVHFHVAKTSFYCRFFVKQEKSKRTITEMQTQVVNGEDHDQYFSRYPYRMWNK